ncbi:MAG: hypothetical protein AVDCRST_MAG93-9286, partial [uncultured Chloroflexia bacterium]
MTNTRGQGVSGGGLRNQRGVATSDGAMLLSSKMFIVCSLVGLKEGGWQSQI